MNDHGGLAVRLRPTMLSDLDFVGSVENDPENRPFITPWERVQHEGAVRFPDFRHFIIEAGPAYPSAGFVILQGCRNPHGSVELKRIVLQPKGLGYGRACVRLLAQMAFRDLGAHRFWLDVARARALPQRGLRRGRSAARKRAQRGWLRLADRDVDARTRIRRARRCAPAPCRRHRLT
jgi:diamine N-acetyltransferase